MKKRLDDELRQDPLEKDRTLKATLRQKARSILAAIAPREYGAADLEVALSDLTAPSVPTETPEDPVDTFDSYVEGTEHSLPSTIEPGAALVRADEKVVGIGTNPKTLVLTQKLRKGSRRKKIFVNINEDLELFAKRLAAIAALPGVLLITLLSRFKSGNVGDGLERLLRELFLNLNGISMHTPTIDQTLINNKADDTIVKKAYRLVSGSVIDMIDEISIATAQLPLVHNRNTHFEQIAPEQILTKLYPEKRKELQYVIQRLSWEDFIALCDFIKDTGDTQRAAVHDKFEEALLRKPKKRTVKEIDALNHLNKFAYRIIDAIVVRNTMIAEAEKTLAQKPQIASKVTHRRVSQELRPEDTRFDVQHVQHGGRGLTAQELLERTQLIALEESPYATEIDTILKGMRLEDKTATRVRVAMATGDQKQLNTVLGEETEVLPGTFRAAGPAGRLRSLAADFHRDTKNSK